MWNRKDHQQHRKIVFFSVRKVTATGIHRDTEKVTALRAWEDQQSSSFCYVHGRAFTKPVSCEMCGEGAVELPRENQAEPSSTHCNARTDVYLLLVLGEMPPGVCWVKPHGTETNPESSFRSLARLYTWKSWIAFSHLTFHVFIKLAT